MLTTDQLARLAFRLPHCRWASERRFGALTTFASSARIATRRLRMLHARCRRNLDLVGGAPCYPWVLMGRPPVYVILYGRGLRQVADALRRVQWRLLARLSSRAAGNHCRSGVKTQVNRLRGLIMGWISSGQLGWPLPRTYGRRGVRRAVNKLYWLRHQISTRVAVGVLRESCRLWVLPEGLAAQLWSLAGVQVIEFCLRRHHHKDLMYRRWRQCRSSTVGGVQRQLAALRAVFYDDQARWLQARNWPTALDNHVH